MPPAAIDGSARATSALREIAISTNISTDKVVATCQARTTGLTSLAAGKKSILIDGKDTAITDAVAVYQRCVDTRADLSAKRRAVTDALSARKAADAARLALDPGIKRWAESTFGPESTALETLGFPVSKRKQPTVETKAQAKAKAKATRQALGTKGKTQKKTAKKKLAASPAPAPTTPPATTKPAGS